MAANIASTPPSQNEPESISAGPDAHDTLGDDATIELGEMGQRAMSWCIARAEDSLGRIVAIEKRRTSRLAFLLGRSLKGPAKSLHSELDQLKDVVEKALYAKSSVKLNTRIVYIFFRDLEVELTTDIFDQLQSTREPWMGKAEARGEEYSRLLPRARAMTAKIKDVLGTG